MKEFILLAGMPGAGKSTWAKNNCAGKKLLTADTIRTEKADPGQAMKELHRAVTESLVKGEDVVVDVCALKPNDRTKWKNLARVHGYKASLVVMDTPVGVCRTRNAGRPRKEQYQADWNKLNTEAYKMKIACKNEGWDSLKIIKYKG